MATTATTATTTRNSYGEIPREEEQCIKSALAFVVMRRRAAAAAAIAAAGSNRDHEGNDGTAARNAVKEGALQQHAPQTKDHRHSLSKSLLLHSSSSSKMSSNAVEHHLRAMIRVAISTALPLYERVGCHKQDQPLVYDYMSASSDLDQVNENGGSSEALSVYRVLDGLLQHLASQFKVVLKNQHLQQQEQEGGGQDKGEEFIVSILCETLELTNSAKTNHAASADTADRDDAFHLHPVRLTMSICTVFHRLAYWEVHTAAVMVKSICRRLYHEYYNQDNNNSTNKNNMSNHHYHHRMSDVRIVNLVTLLEGILDLLLLTVQDKHNKGDALVSDVLQIMQHELGDLVVPVSSDDMARFYYDNSLLEQEGNLASNRTTCNASDLAQGNDPENGTKQHPQEVPSITPASKLLLRLALYDVVLKLSWYIS